MTQNIITVKIVVGDDWEGDRQRVIFLKMAARKHMVIAHAQTYLRDRHYVIGCHHINVNHHLRLNRNLMSIHAGIVIIITSVCQFR